MSSKIVLTAFVDGLKPSSIKYMPFLNSLEQKKRIKTDLGYSITCHATMYTGVFPNKHHMWFVWKYSPETSPFRLIPNSSAVKYMDSLLSRYTIGKLSRLFARNSSYAGVSIMKKSAMKNWSYFDVSEHKLWDEDGYLETAPTIFEILRNNNIDFRTVGLVSGKYNGGALSHIKNYTAKDETAKWVYLFIGGVDQYSHKYTQEDEKTIQLLKDVDREIERIYTELTKNHDQVDFFCFSDHGHMKVEKQFDIYQLFSKHGIDLDSYIHIIDTNYARFWPRNLKEENQIKLILNEIPSGFILNEKHLKKYNTSMPDNRYGDIVYYLDFPYMFKKTVWGYGLRTNSIHGYLPDYKEKDGVLVANRKAHGEEYITLADIAPSLLELLEVKGNREFDGNTIWR